jgi:hypothetical protein
MRTSLGQRLGEGVGDLVWLAGLTLLVPLSLAVICAPIALVVWTINALVLRLGW